MAFIHRSILRTISALLADHALVLVEGPPRCGMSTLARQLAASTASGAVILDARGREGRARVADPAAVSAARPLILDNAGAAEAAAISARLALVSAHPHGREAPYGLAGRRGPRFVLMGGPFSLAGPGSPRDGPGSFAHVVSLAGPGSPRDGPEPLTSTASIAGPGSPGVEIYGGAGLVRIGPFSLFEVGRASVRQLWSRGGYPEAFGADTDEAAFCWLDRYATDLAYGALANWGLPRSPGLAAGLLELVALENGHPFNENEAARSLGVSRPTISRYLAVLHHAGIVFSMPAFEGGAPLRRRKSPVHYIRDSGLLHALLGTGANTGPALKPHALATSWAGFVVAQAIMVAPPGIALWHYASADGANLDLVATRGGVPLVVAAARRFRPVSLERSAAYAARAVAGADSATDLDSAAGAGAARGAEFGRYIVVPDGPGRPLAGGFVIIGLGAFLELLAAL